MRLILSAVVCFALPFAANSEGLWSKVKKGASRVVSDQCEPVSVRTANLFLMPHKIDATQREQLHD